MMLIMKYLGIPIAVGIVTLIAFCEISTIFFAAGSQGDRVCAVIWFFSYGVLTALASAQFSKAVP